MCVCILFGLLVRVVPCEPAFNPLWILGTSSRTLVQRFATVTIAAVARATSMWHRIQWSWSKSHDDLLMETPTFGAPHCLSNRIGSTQWES
eukprot:5367180-Amphidinium_carterae.2